MLILLFLYIFPFPKNTLTLLFQFLTKVFHCTANTRSKGISTIDMFDLTNESDQLYFRSIDTSYTAFNLNVSPR
ncbi:hypothetical protein EDC96DRAFT_276720 [Choanephora cucurbitarum]|nr:hypothetical protein EDC96DRAFT_276720 [Choanephora cucurbitarum]